MAQIPKKRASAPKKSGILYVGMDLGTSRTSVSASNGTRETVSSIVGYPKDAVSKKLLQQEVLYGDAALEKRLSLDLYRPLEKGVIKFSASDESSSEAAAYRRAARDLVHHAVTLARPRPDELVYGVIGAPAQASLRNKQAILEAAREKLDAVMLCSEPFSVAYGLDQLDEALVIDLGAGTVDLCRMRGTLPEEEDQITLETAGDFLDGEIFRALKTRHPQASFTINMVKQIKEKHGFVTEAAETVRVSLPVAGKPTFFDLTDLLRENCRKIIPPIVESMQKLLASFDPEFQHRLRNNVLLGGGGSQLHGLGRALEDAFREYGGGRVTTVEEPIYAGANGALKLAYDMPEEYWEELKG